METLRTYLSTLTPAEQADYASRAGTSIGYLRKAMSKGQRFDGALVRLLSLESAGAVACQDLRPDIWPPTESRLPTVAAIRQLVDSRMSKRALRAKFGYSSDAHLAKVLGLPVEQVEGWGETDTIPALPQVMKLLGHEPEQPVPRKPEDPDENRIIPVEAA